jgi:hypothetical protein
MAKHKKAAGAAAVVHEEKRALERASEIRLREPDPKGDTELYDAGDPRDTEPAPPPTFEPNGSIWSDFDRELTMSTLRLEDALHDCTSERAGAHVLLVMADAEALADALFALWSQTRAARPAWAKAVSRVYRWACDVVDQLEEALVVGPDGEEEILSSFRRWARRSTKPTRTRTKRRSNASAPCATASSSSTGRSPAPP